MNEKSQPSPHETPEKETHPLITLAVVAVGTKLGAELIIRLAKHPLLLFGMGVLSGVYANRSKDDILDAASQLKDKTIHVINKKAEE